MRSGLDDLKQHAAEVSFRLEHRARTGRGFRLEKERPLSAAPELGEGRRRKVFAVANSRAASLAGTAGGVMWGGHLRLLRRERVA